VKDLKVAVSIIILNIEFIKGEAELTLLHVQILLKTASVHTCFLFHLIGAFLGHWPSLRGDKHHYKASNGPFNYLKFHDDIINIGKSLDGVEVL